jgi:hypothetical protein
MLSEPICDGQNPFATALGASGRHTRVHGLSLNEDKTTAA